MAADGREIPGFYYDPEKRRYFKIEKNHIAVASSRYSQQNVKAIKEESRKRKRAERTSRKRQAQTLQCARVIRHHLAAGTALDRELGITSRANLLSSKCQAFVSDLRPQTCVDLQRRRALGLHKPTILSLDHDAATGGLLIGVVDRLNQGTVMSLAPQTPGEGYGKISPGRRSKHSQDVRAIMAAKSDISSVNITASRAVVITSQGGSTPPIVHLTRLLDPAEAENEFMPVDSGMSMQFRHPDVTTIWTSSASPYEASGNDQIAIGTQSSVISINGSGHWQTHPAMQTDSDVLALEWIGPHTLAAGLRNAEVRLWDSRSNGSSIRLRHQGVVTGLKSAGNESQIVVDGLRSSLCMYDLRMVKPPKGSQRSSRPLIRFASESHREMYPTGFDVSPELGIVITAGDRDYLTAYSLRSGRRVKSWNLSDGLDGDHTNKHGEGVVRCARFAENTRGAPKIIASLNSRIMDLSW